jgi:hypothetical protein
MEFRAGGGAGDDEVVKEAVGGTTSCFGLGPLDGSVPGMESSWMSRMTERVSAGDVGDI